MTTNDGLADDDETLGAQDLVTPENLTMREVRRVANRANRDGDHALAAYCDVVVGTSSDPGRWIQSIRVVQSFRAICDSINARRAEDRLQRSPGGSAPDLASAPDSTPTSTKIPTPAWMVEGDSDVAADVCCSPEEVESIKDVVDLCLRNFQAIGPSGRVNIPHQARIECLRLLVKVRTVIQGGRRIESMVFRLENSAWAAIKAAAAVALDHLGDMDSGQPIWKSAQSVLRVIDVAERARPKADAPARSTR